MDISTATKDDAKIGDVAESNKNADRDEEFNTRYGSFRGSQLAIQRVKPIPRDTEYASVFESDVPIVVQHTRLDSRRAEIALLSTVAYAEA